MMQIDWNKFSTDLETLTGQIAATGYKPDLLVAVARGGFIPARMLSDLLGVKKISSIGLAYTDKERTKLECYAMPEPIRQGAKILLIEDCLESGKSLQHAKILLEQKGAAVKTASVYKTDKTVFTLDFCAGHFTIPPRMPWEL